VGKSVRRVPKKATLPPMKPSEYSHVAVLRLAHPDAPSIREVARQLGMSVTWLATFERGMADLSPEKLAAYAKAIDRSPEEVAIRWMQQALTYHEQNVEQLRAALAKAGKRGRPGQRPKAAGPKRRINLDRRAARA